MSLDHEFHYGIIAISQLTAVSGITALLLSHVLRVQVTLDRADMAHEISNREFSRLIRPFDLLRRDAARHAQSALANLFVVIQESRDAGDFH